MCCLIPLLSGPVLSFCMQEWNGCELQNMSFIRKNDLEIIIYVMIHESALNFLLKRVMLKLSCTLVLFFKMASGSA